MKFFRSNIGMLATYFLVAVMFIMLGSTLLFLNEKRELHLMINDLHASGLDVIFTYGTYLGDGLITAILVLPIGLILYKKYKVSTFVLGWLSLILTGVFAQTLKRVIFPLAERPKRFLAEDELYFVPGVDVYEWNSFPSGHTATAFAFFAFLSIAFFPKNRFMQGLFALIAVFVGYSRMYLSQHFLEDVVTGAIVGLSAYIIASLITSAIFKKNSIV
jgi:membrane-associated phospholipid phosphatase